MANGARFRALWCRPSRVRIPSPACMDIFLYNSAEIDDAFIVKSIEKIFSVKVVRKGFMEIPSWTYNTKREQYYAPALLSLLKEKISVWIVDDDIFTDGMNFIFGLAEKGKKAIVSAYRLGSSEMIEKEVIHEVGHVFGLFHCKNECVMQFSNSLMEAKKKPSWLCEECQKKLRDKINI